MIMFNISDTKWFEEKWKKIQGCFKLTSTHSAPLGTFKYHSSFLCKQITFQLHEHFCSLQVRQKKRIVRNAACWTPKNSRIPCGFFWIHCIHVFETNYTSPGEMLYLLRKCNFVILFLILLLIFVYSNWLWIIGFGGTFFPLWLKTVRDNMRIFYVFIRLNCTS